MNNDRANKGGKKGNFGHMYIKFMYVGLSEAVMRERNPGSVFISMSRDLLG